MLAYLKGKILKKGNKGVILKYGDIGYFIFLKSLTLAKLSHDQDAEFFLHQHISEDAHELYGFEDFEEFELFKLLLNVKGIGPKVALEITNLPPEKFRTAITTEDIPTISKIPGIGKKTAQRLILELKGELKNFSTEQEISTNIPPDVESDLHEALNKLGFSRKQISVTLQKMPAEITELESIMEYFLKNV